MREFIKLWRTNRPHFRNKKGISGTHFASEHILFRESNLLGCTRADLHIVSSQIAEPNSLQHRFKTGKAGKFGIMDSCPTIQSQYEQQELLGSIKMFSRYS